MSNDLDKFQSPLFPQSCSDSFKEFRSSFYHAIKVPFCCPLCAGAVTLPIGYGDRHNLGLSVVMCQRCGMATIAPRPEATWFDQFYQKHYWPVYLSSRFKDLDDLYLQDQCAERSRQIFEAIAPNLPCAPRNYLDVGCGQGAMLVEFRRRYPSAACAGVEPSVDAAAFCLRRHNLKIIQRPWYSFETEDLLGPFELITLIHMLEHVPDPVGVLTQTVGRLAPQGMIYVEVPDLLSERWSGKDFFHIAHVWYFHEAALRNLFLRCGLEIVDVVRGAADIWPWAIGFVGQRGAARPYPPEAVPVVPLGFEDRVRNHLAVRGAPIPARDLPHTLAHEVMNIDGERADTSHVRLLPKEATANSVRQDEIRQWLYLNRSERMDASDNSGLFAFDRQAFHRGRYAFAVDYVKGREVADIACGLGYGCRILKEGGANTVVGIDRCLKAVQYARSIHGVEGVCFVTGDATEIPLAASSLDVIISFETIEHVPNTTALLAEFHRLLRPDGRLIVSSPNDWGLTEHHCHSWTPFELSADIAAHFGIESIWEQNSTASESGHDNAIGIRQWSKATEHKAECLIVVARKLPMKVVAVNYRD